MCGIIGYVGSREAYLCSSKVSSASSTAAMTRPGIALLEDEGLELRSGRRATSTS